MREISLHILDIAQNSISANATEITIRIIEALESDLLEVTIGDNGIGMEQDLLENICDPFCTTRKTRRVGMGISLFKAAAEGCDGSFNVTTILNKGTKVVAAFRYSHIDRAPVGDIVETLISLIASNPTIDFIFEYKIENNSFEFKTREAREILNGVDINNHEVIMWLIEYLNEGLKTLQNHAEDTNK